MNEYHTQQQELQFVEEVTMTKKNVDVEFDSDVGYPYHLQPDIIKMALFIHNATSEQEKINRVEFGVNKFDYKFMAHVMALLMLPYLMNENMDSAKFKQWQEDRMKKFN
jgi:hypothetical protein